MTQDQVEATLANILRAAYGADMPAKEIAKIAFETFESLHILDWFKVDPSFMKTEEDE